MLQLATNLSARDDDDDAPYKIFGRPCKRFTRHTILILALVLYAFVGAAIFQTLEESNQTSELQRNKVTGAERRTKFLQNVLLEFRLKNESYFQPNCSDYDNFTRCLEKWLEKELILYELQLGVDQEAVKYKWTFWNALFYAGTVFTTIGYGHMYCKTLIGQIATIFYALFGIPLMFLVLSDLSKVMYKLSVQVWNCVIRGCRKTRQLSEMQRMLSLTSINILDYHEMKIPFTVALVALFLYVCVCAAIFLLWEPQWSYWTAFYFFFISLSTIGFGDIVPQNPAFTAIGFILIIIGLSIVNICISATQVGIGSTYTKALARVEKKLHSVKIKRLQLAELAREAGRTSSISRYGSCPDLRKDSRDVNEILASFAVENIDKRFKAHLTELQRIHGKLRPVDASESNSERDDFSFNIYINSQELIPNSRRNSSTHSAHRAANSHSRKCSNVGFSPINQTLAVPNDERFCLSTARTT